LERFNRKARKAIIFKILFKTLSSQSVAKKLCELSEKALRSLRLKHKVMQLET